MLDWLKKKLAPVEAAAPAEPRKNNGFFSTDIAFDLALDEVDRTDQIKELFKQSFQRSDKDMKVVTVGADGKESTQAMDEAYPDLQLAKMQNSMGGFLPYAQLAWYASQGFIGYQTAAMISQNWLIDKACSMPARDAVRHGYEITSNDGEEIDPKILNFMRLRDKAYRIKSQCVEFLRMGRIFGIRVAMFDVVSTDPQYYEKPFNLDGVTAGSYKGISQIDPYWITPELDAQAAANPASRHFYEPTWWRINGKRVHRTHLVIMRNGGELPDILKPTYFYGGIPVPQKIAERVYAAERTANEAPMLAMSKRLTVLNVDITQALSNLQAFTKKMDIWSQLMNNYGIKIIGEDEKIEQFDTALSDLDEVIMTQYQIVSAASEVPSTKLLGTSPKGFGASGEYEESSYHEMLESLQEHELTPLIERHHQLLVRSEMIVKFSLPKDFATEIMWKPTDTPTAKEQAEINKSKADTDNVLVQAGAIDGTDVRNRLIADPDSGYNGIEAIVPGGPGDREAQQEAERLALQGPQEPVAIGDALESRFDRVLGRFDGARLITHQKFLDETIVAQKAVAKDYDVHVTPEFEMDGKAYRMIFDGHHSLAAALMAGEEPNFITEMPREEIMNAITRMTTDAKNK